MLTGELRSKIDNVWNAFWAGGIANPLEVIEQITYLLFMRGLDDLHTLAERKATRLGKPIERRIFPAGKDKIGKGGGIAYEDLRCSPRWSTSWPKSRWRIATPRATSTNTCCRRSPAPGRTASSAPRATSSR